MDPREAAIYLLQAYERLRALAQLQLESVRKEDWEEFSKLEAQYRGMQEEIDRTGKRYGKEIRAGGHSRSKDILSSIRSIQDQISGINQEMEALLKERQSTLLDGLKGLRHAKKAIGRYAMAKSPSPKFLDTRG